MKTIIFALIGFFSLYSLAETIQERKAANPHAKHDHGGAYDNNPETDEYQYTDKNGKDNIRRHSFILLGAKKKLGYHISFFESGHQHQVVLKLKYSDDVLPLLNRRPPRNGFHSVTLERKTNDPQEGRNFVLHTIGDREEPDIRGDFFDGIIGSGSRLSRAQDIDIEVEGVHHFTRLHVDDSTQSAQYMVFRDDSDPEKQNRYFLMHMIYGFNRTDNLGNGQNFEHIVVADMAEGTAGLEDGSILIIPTQNDKDPLLVNSSYDGNFYRKGSKEEFSSNETPIKFTVKSEVHKRFLGLDPSQNRVRR